MSAQLKSLHDQIDEAKQVHETIKTEIKRSKSEMSAVHEKLLKAKRELKSLSGRVDQLTSSVQVRQMHNMHISISVKHLNM